MMKKLYSNKMLLSLDDKLHLSINTVSKKIGIDMTKIIRFLIENNKSIYELEELLKNHDQEDGVDITFLIENGYIII